MIHDGARIGRGCKIHTAASISCLPQDLKFVGEATTCEIGDCNDIREYVTISRGTASTGTTRVGSHNLLMAYVHVAHDCVVGSHCVIANRVSLAGEVHVGDWVVIGGHAAIHQWTHIGEHSMIQGGACSDRTFRLLSSSATTRSATRASTRSDFRAAASRPSASARSTTPAGSSSRAA